MNTDFWPFVRSQSHSSDFAPPILPLNHGMKFADSLTSGRAFPDLNLWQRNPAWQGHRAAMTGRRSAASLPADDKSPSVSSLGVPDFIDEGISAPYPGQRADREEILNGLAWLEKESEKRFARVFADLNDKQKHDICDDICFVPRAKPGFKTAAWFFAKFRNLTAGGFYTTPQGWKDIQYLGNVALAKFGGPPPEVLKYLNLD